MQRSTRSCSARSSSSRSELSANQTGPFVLPPCPCAVFVTQISVRRSCPTLANCVDAMRQVFGNGLGRIQCRKQPADLRELQRQRDDGEG